MSGVGYFVKRIQVERARNLYPQYGFAFVGYGAVAHFILPPLGRSGSALCTQSGELYFDVDGLTQVCLKCLHRAEEPSA